MLLDIYVAACSLHMQLAHYECPMTPRQLEYLDRIHRPVIAKYQPTQHHFDLMAAYLIESIQEHGAEVSNSSGSSSSSSTSRART
jgi:hypothetical protein